MYKKLLSLAVCLSLSLTIPLNVFAQTTENEIIKLYEKDFLFYHHTLFSEGVTVGESNKFYSISSNELESLMYIVPEAKVDYQNFQFNDRIFWISYIAGLSIMGLVIIFSDYFNKPTTLLALSSSLSVVIAGTLIFLVPIAFAVQSRSDLNNAIRKYNKFLLKNKINELENSNKINTLDGVRFNISF